MFTVEVAAGACTARWYGVDERASLDADEVTVPVDRLVKVAAPPAIQGPAVLHLKARP
ncbi:hypothetical protein ACIBH1_23810 [Nonomuraea sp. NPDC050663]|uniref:hypothetical protein n=1 Tax=Nonomuraea sp. NPDC050663 TaxID=3364370 RepID=UPI0037906824